MRSVLAALLAAAAFATGCSTSHSAAPDSPGAAAARTHSGQYPIKVVCTTGMVADLVRAVGGSHVDVSQLMGEGVDPHLYKTSPGDVSALNGADVIFYSGLHLEGKMVELFEQMARTKPTTAVAEYIDPRLILHSGESHDPHVWFDVSLWEQALRQVSHALCDYDPAHADEYRRRTAEYSAELDKLHQYAATRIAEIPQRRRVLVTAHDAFRYFGRAYKIDVRGIQGISTDSEAGVHEINKLVGFIVQRGIKAVFIESSVSDRNIKALVEGCGARGHTVVIGGELFSDAMGKQGTPEGTYVGMVRHNVDTIVSALK